MIYSEREWPISGGDWSPASCSYSEIVLTGHQDGSLKFWDSGAGALQVKGERWQFLDSFIHLPSESFIFH